MELIHKIHEKKKMFANEIEVMVNKIHDSGAEAALYMIMLM